MSDLNETIPFDGEGSLEDNTVVREQEEGVLDERESDGNFKRSPKSKISGQIKAAEESGEKQTTHSSKTLHRPKSAAEKSNQITGQKFAASNLNDNPGQIYATGGTMTNNNNPGQIYAASDNPLQNNRTGPNSASGEVSYPKITETVFRCRSETTEEKERGRSQTKKSKNPKRKRSESHSPVKKNRIKIKKLKNETKRQYRPRSSSASNNSSSSDSSSETDNSSSEESSDEDRKSRNYFSLEKKTKNKLRTKSKKMVNNQAVYIDEEIQKHILTKHSVPKNVLQVNELDSFIKDAIDEAIEANPRNTRVQGLKFELARDKQLKHIEKKIRDIYGPLTSLLRILEKKENVKLTSS